MMETSPSKLTRCDLCMPENRSRCVAVPAFPGRLERIYWPTKVMPKLDIIHSETIERCRRREMFLMKPDIDKQPS